MIDFSFVAEALKRANEFIHKAPEIFPRLCAYHKCRLKVEKEQTKAYCGFRPTCLAGLVSTVDGHTIFGERFYDVLSDAHLKVEIIKMYIEGDIYSEDLEFKSSVINVTSIEELDVQLTVRGY